MSINLSKGGRIDLSKREDGSAINTSIFFGANWGMIQRGGGFLGFGKSKEAVDLDASVVMLDATKRKVDVVYFGHKNSNDGSIHHSGDDLTGDADGDDGIDNEVISVNLSKVDNKVEYLVFILNSYQHHKFNEIPYMGLRVYTTQDNKPVTRPGQSCEVLATYNLKNDSSDPETTFQDREAIVLGYAYRKNGGWKFKACGNTSNSQSISEMIQHDIPHII